MNPRIRAATFMEYVNDVAYYSAVIPKIESIIRGEMSKWGIGGISVALVAAQATVLAEGFGEARRDPPFHAGSISKLFNAVAVMQQVEAGKLDLDSPLPADLKPLTPLADAPAVTHRRLLPRRSGQQRKWPLGGYLDDAQPGIAAAAARHGCERALRLAHRCRRRAAGD